jgi:hypothetical protein
METPISTFRVWTKNWVVYSDVLAYCGTMEFVLGPEPVQ